MVIYGDLVGFSGIYWIFMVIHGDFMGIYW